MRVSARMGRMGVPGKMRVSARMGRMGVPGKMRVSARKGGWVLNDALGQDYT